MINYRTTNGKAADDFINWVANLATVAEVGPEPETDGAVLDRIILRARGLTTASGPLGMLLKDENLDPAFRRALADNERGVG